MLLGGRRQQRDVLQLSQLDLVLQVLDVGTDAVVFPGDELKKIFILYYSILFTIRHFVDFYKTVLDKKLLRFTSS